MSHFYCAYYISPCYADAKVVVEEAPKEPTHEEILQAETHDVLRAGETTA